MHREQNERVCRRSSILCERRWTVCVRQRRVSYRWSCFGDWWSSISIDHRGSNHRNPSRKTSCNRFFQNNFIYVFSNEIPTNEQTVISTNIDDIPRRFIVDDPNVSEQLMIHEKSSVSLPASFTRTSGGRQIFQVSIIVGEQIQAIVEVPNDELIIKRQCRFFSLSRIYRLPSV